MGLVFLLMVSEAVVGMDILLNAEESFYEKKPEITNNQAEYMAIISALKKFVDVNDEITILVIQKIL